MLVCACVVFWFNGQKISLSSVVAIETHHLKSMAESSSSSTGGVQVPAVPLAADKGGNYSEEEVRALRSKGIEAEKGDKWEEATEAYSHALELWYDGNKGEGGRK